MLLHGNNGYVNASKYYFRHTLPELLQSVAKLQHNHSLANQQFRFYNS